MGESIYFDESSIPIPDDWFSLSNEKDVKSFKNHDLSTNQKGGLGYTGAMVAPIHDDILAKRLDLKRKKKKEELHKSYEDDIEEHGVIERHEISRTSIGILNKSSNKVNAKASKRLKDQPKMPSTVKILNDNIVENNQPVVSNLPSNSDLIRSIDVNDFKVDLSNLNHTSNSNLYKKSKKRSKQKNIRKDNRADSEKPNYLLPGPSYRGYLLTEETKRILSTKSAAVAGGNRGDKISPTTGTDKCVSGDVSVNHLIPTARASTVMANERDKSGAETVDFGVGLDISWSIDIRKT